MIFQYLGVNFAQCRLHCLRLGENINAVLIVLHHMDNFIQMSAGNLESMEWITVHLGYFNPPGGDCQSVIIIIYVRIVLGCGNQVLV